VVRPMPQAASNRPSMLIDMRTSFQSSQTSLPDVPYGGPSGPVYPQSAQWANQDGAGLGRPARNLGPGRAAPSFTAGKARQTRREWNAFANAWGVVWCWSVYRRLTAE